MRRRLALLLLVLVAVEIGSFGAHWIARGRPFSWAESEARRREILDAESEGRFVAGNVAVPWKVGIHPYFGFGEPPGFGFAAGDAASPVLDADTVVVAVTGGSVSQRMRHHAAAVLEAEIAQIPRFAGKRVASIGIGHFAWKQPQQLQALAYFLALGGRLDVLVNLDGYNEVMDAAIARRRGLFPAYPVLWGFLTRNAFGADEVERIGERTTWRKVRKRLATAFSRLRWSVTASLVWEIADDRVARRIVARESESTGEAKAAYVKSARGPERTFASPEEFRRFCALVWKDSSVAMKHLAEGAGASYFHFLQPSQYLEGSKPLSEEELRDAFNPSKNSPAAGYPFLLELAPALEKEEVAFRSLVDVFHGRTETLYADPCCHVNQRGNEILAREIGATIREFYRARDGTPAAVR